MPEGTIDGDGSIPVYHPRDVPAEPARAYPAEVGQVGQPDENSPNLEGKKMAVDLTENVANQLLADLMGGLKQTAEDGRNSAALAQAHMRFAASRNFDEVGTLEGRATAGVNATPLAPPSTQG